VSNTRDDCRNIPIALVDTIFSEQKAQTCEKAWLSQVSRFRVMQRKMPPVSWAASLVEEETFVVRDELPY
jgi:hypothetical protein